MNLHAKMLHRMARLVQAVIKVYSFKLLFAGVFFFCVCVYLNCRRDILTHNVMDVTFFPPDITGGLKLLVMSRESDTNRLTGAQIC